MTLYLLRVEWLDSPGMVEMHAFSSENNRRRYMADVASIEIGEDTAERWPNVLGWFNEMQEARRLDFDLEDVELDR